MDTSLEMRVVLSFTAQYLKNEDFLSKSDPYIVVKNARGTIVGRTETVKNKATVTFTKEIECDYRFEEEQMMTVIVMDDDYGRSQDDFLGQAQFKLGTLMGSRGQSLKLPLTNSSGRPYSKSTVTVHAEQAGSDDTAAISLQARGLENKDGFFSKSDPYFVVTVADESSSTEFREVYKSEFIKNNLNPVWKPFYIPLRRIQNKRAIRIEVWDYDSTGKNDLIGYCTTTLAQLESHAKGMPVIHPPTKSKYSSSSYKNSGLIDVNSFVVEKQYTMIDFLRGGLEISLVVAVDFTGSNGDPSRPGTLHYGGGTIPNAYTTAITGVGQILLEYDSNKMVPALGFGAKLSWNSTVSHCFAMSMGPEEVHGLDGILNSYRTAFSSGLSLSGPTYFSEILKKTADIARGMVNSYAVVLILTDGVLNDPEQTIDALVELSFLPVSVVIVGVGNADFSQMKVLDADVNLLVSSKGVRAARDCVQFVEFNRVQNNGTLLAKETLMELPAQIVGYMKRNNRVPGRPIQVADEEIRTVPFQPPPGGVPVGAPAGVVPPPPVAGGSYPPSYPGYPPPPPQSAQSIAQTGREIFRGAFSM